LITGFLHKGAKPPFPTKSQPPLREQGKKVRLLFQGRTVDLRRVSITILIVVTFMIIIAMMLAVLVIVIMSLVIWVAVVIIMVIWIAVAFILIVGTP